MISGNKSAHPRVEWRFSPNGTSVLTDAVLFLGDMSVCSGRTVLEFMGEARMGYLGSAECRLGETCDPPQGGFYHFLGPPFPMTIRRQ
jgi:hypothetical protein